MKVLHILNQLNPSGAEVMLRAAAANWVSMGLDLHVLSTGSEVGPYAESLASSGYRVHHIPFSKTFSFFKAVADLIRRERFDVVHIHAERANFVYGIIARMAGVPKVVRTIHSVFPFRGNLRFQRMLQRAVMRAFGITQVSVGQNVQRVEKRHFLNRTRVIANWYDSDHFRPPSISEREDARSVLGISQEARVITSVGNCSPVKNHPALIEALAALKDERVCYLHVGREDEKASERALSQQLQLDHKIRFLGYLKDPRRILWASDVFVMPSLYEGVSIAAVEALATGLACVFTKVDGLKGILPDDKAIFYSDNDPAALSQAIVQAVRYSEEGDTYRLTTSKKIKMKYSKERGALEYLALYQDNASPGFGR